MLIAQFVDLSAETIVFRAEQASRFAKQVAEDFNPIHDADSKRFCVPGDLLFATLLSKFGLSRELHCRFEGMVGDNVELHIAQQGDEVSLQDANGKSFLTLQCSGDKHTNCQFVDQLIRDYVRFSGQNFPHILQPLMKQHQVMINPSRPLVIYQSMALHFHEFTDGCPQLRLSSSELLIDGKRGNVVLRFEFLHQGKVIGTGEKRMILSNLVPYDDTQMQALVDLYNERKASLSVAA
ncbi:MAG TPA: DUF3581 domain-containing protein [Rheinheimera sp.]|nr:DUF3581 domain-containing protein [Rheinheimera sp.]